MLSQILIAIFSGIFFGIITGLTPGIHVNLISVFVLGASSYLLKYFNLIDLCIFLVAMSITHIFLDSIPSIFLGAPEAGTELGVLPGHRYLLKGNGYMAVKLTIVGAFFALVISILIFPLTVWLVGKIYGIISDYIGYFLAAIMAFMIIKDRNKIWAFLIFLISGIFGVIVLNMPNLKDPLFPMLSGMFGISTLLISLNSNQKIPEQKISTEIKVDTKKTIQALSSGQFSGFMTSVLPGIGASTAAVMAMQITRKLGDHGFMVLMGAASMVNFVLSIGTLYSINKARNGIIVAISEIMQNISVTDIMFLLFSALVTAGIAVFLGLKIGKVFSGIMDKIDYNKVVIGVIIFIIILVFVFSGFLGLFIIVVSTAIGILPALKKVTRTHGMACLVLPVILYYLL